MFKRETLEASKLARREASFPRGMIVDALTSAAYSFSNRQVTGIRALVELGPKLGAMVWEVARDSVNGVLHGAETR